MKLFTKCLILGAINGFIAIEAWELSNGRGTMIFKLGKEEDYEKKLIFIYLRSFNSWLKVNCSKNYATSMIKIVEDRLSNKSINSYNDEMLLRDILHRAKSIEKWCSETERTQDQIMNSIREKD